MGKQNLRKNSAFIYATLAVITAIVLRQIGFRIEGPSNGMARFFVLSYTLDCLLRGGFLSADGLFSRRCGGILPLFLF